MTHTCQCRMCAAEKFPERPSPRPESYVNFFEAGCKEWANEHTKNVFLNGANVNQDCREALAGEQGYVIRLGRNEKGCVHLCQRCFDGVCEEVRYGWVEIETNDGGRYGVRIEYVRAGSRG